MDDFITLACPNCRAPIKKTKDVDTFVCDHCGYEHILRQPRGSEQERQKTQLPTISKPDIYYQGNIDKPVAQISSSAQPAVRTKTTTIWLWIVIILNAIVGVMSFSQIGTLTGLGISPVTLIVSACLSLGVAVGAFLILQWKKMGFYIVSGCIAVNVLVALFGGGNVGTTIFGAIIGLGILYYVLQYPKDNKAWDHLV